MVAKENERPINDLREEKLDILLFTIRFRKKSQRNGVRYIEVIQRKSKVKWSNVKNFDFPHDSATTPLQLVNIPLLRIENGKIRLPSLQSVKRSCASCQYPSVHRRKRDDFYPSTTISRTHDAYYDKCQTYQDTHSAKWMQSIWQRKGVHLFFIVPCVRTQCILESIWTLSRWLIALHTYRLR